RIKGIFMKIKWMERIDKHLGDALIYAVCGVIKLRSFLPGATHSSPHLKFPKVIVIAKFFGMGSILQTIPLMQEIKKEYPSCKLVFLSFSGNAPLVSMLECVDETL